LSKETAETSQVMRVVEPKATNFDEDFFHELPTEKLVFIAATKQRKLKKNEYLYMEGELATTLFYIKTGTLKTTRINTHGKEMIVHIQKPGSLIGLSAALHGDCRLVNAQALTASEVYEIDNVVFRTLLLTHPALLDRAFAAMVRRFSFLNNRYLSAMYENAASRLRMFLANQYYEYLVSMRAGRRDESISLHIDQEVMASLVGISRQTVNQLLHNLARDEIIRIHRDKIIFLNPDYFLNAVEI
jgi:CRP-like cAMP-binding protein